jgi:hypothetical protein
MKHRPALLIAGVFGVGVACLWASRSHRAAAPDGWVVRPIALAGSPATQPATQPAGDVGCCGADEVLADFGREIRDLESVIAKTEAALRKEAENQLHLAGVAEIDRETYAQHDLSAEAIAKASSEELCRFFCNKFGGAILLYDDRQIAVARAHRSSPSLQALLARPDAVDGILNYASSISWESVEHIESSVERGKVSFLPIYVDSLLAYEPLIARTAGHEKRILRMLVDRYQRILATQRRMAAAGKEGSYSSVSIEPGAKLALRLWHRLDPESAREQIQAGSLRTLNDIYQQVANRFLNE